MQGFRERAKRRAAWWQGISFLDVELSSQQAAEYCLVHTYSRILNGRGFVTEKALALKQKQRRQSFLGGPSRWAKEGGRVDQGGRVL